MAKLPVFLLVLIVPVILSVIIPHKVAIPYEVKTVLRNYGYLSNKYADYTNSSDPYAFYLDGSKEKQQFRRKPVVGVLNGAPYTSTSKIDDTLGYIFNGTFYPGTIPKKQKERLVPRWYISLNVFFPDPNAEHVHTGDFCAITAPCSTFKPGGVNAKRSLFRKFGHMANGFFYFGDIKNVPSNKPGPIVPGYSVMRGVLFPLSKDGKILKSTPAPDELICEGYEKGPYCSFFPSTILEPAGSSDTPNLRTDI